MTKISRNTKCPCGSGLKYKKCCLNKTEEIDDFFNDIAKIKTEDANVDKELVEIFKTIFNEYNYFELVRAVFCMNSWRGNRPELVFYLSLNAAAVECEKQGTKNINTYEEFKDFHLAIKKHYAHSVLVDENIPDFGDIVIDYNKEFFPVYVGTGHNFIFSLMQCVSTIARYLKKEDQFLLLLEYVKIMVNALADNNPYEKDRSFGDLFLPSENHFQSCCDYYKPFYNQELALNFEKMISSDGKYNKDIHFINFEEKLYSLFDPGIIVTFIELLIRNLSEQEKDRLAEYCLYDAAAKNYAIDPESRCLLYPVGIIEDEQKKKLVDNYSDGLLLLGGGKAIFFVNENSNSDFEYDKYVRKINSYSDGNKVEFIELSNDNKKRVVQTTNISSYKVISYNNHININEDFVMMLGKEDLYRKAVLDIIYILYASDSIEEIYDFYDSKDQNTFQVIGNDGDSALFDAWKRQSGLIEQGATKISLLSTGLNAPEWNMFHKYRGLLKYYPFNNYTEMFSNPHIWRFDDTEMGMYHLTNKAVNEFGGSYRKVGDSSLFIAYNLSFNSNLNFNYREREEYTLLDDLMSRLFITYEDVLVSNGFYDAAGVQIMFMPKDYAEKASLKINADKYVSSDYYFVGNRLIIRYYANLEKLFMDISVAKTKKVECDFTIELLQCIEKTNINFKDIRSMIESDNLKEKDITVLCDKVNYYFSSENFVFKIKDNSFVKAKKEIAKCCLDAGVFTGEYIGEKATKVVRKIQELLIPNFEARFLGYDKIDLHLKLLSRLAHYTHEKTVNARRHNLVEDKTLSEEARIVTEKNAREMREKSKQQIKNILYLIETNLAVDRDGEDKIGDDELDFISAFADWLIVLQDNADLSHKEINFVKIVVNDDYVVDTVIVQDDPRNTQIRTYANIDYVPKYEESPILIDDVISEFQKDTGISMEDIMLVCHYLRLEFVYTFRESEENPDVFMVDKYKLIEDLLSTLVDKDKIEEMRLRVEKTLDYLSIESNKIKFLNGKEHQFIPVWEREKRSNRFDIRPIVATENNLIFSPIILNELLKVWQCGLIDLYLPYEIGLTNTCQKIAEWKEWHESQMEKDILGIFQDKGGFVAVHSFDFNKRDKIKTHPQELGDYDVIALNTLKKEIWNIESKNLHKVGSVSEFSNQQKGFFLQNKYDEKFQRRIDYLKNHLKDLLRLLKIDDDFNKYTQKDYMVTNKVFTAVVKIIDFDIITFHELRRLVEDNDK